MEIFILVAFSLGLASTLHCWGMCGGIMGALAFGLPESVRSNRLALTIYITIYNLGRISSYSFAGLIAGTISATLVNSLSVENGHHLLRILAATVLVVIGLQLSGLFPRLQRLETVGSGLWKRLQPLAKNFFPVRTIWRAFCFGLVWGWLPCGLVYSALLWASASGDPVSGGLYMFAFGLGTLPGVITAGILSGTILNLSRIKGFRYGVASLMIIFGLVLFFTPNDHGNLSASGNVNHMH